MSRVSALLLVICLLPAAAPAGELILPEGAPPPPPAGSSEERAYLKALDEKALPLRPGESSVARQALELPAEELAEFRELVREIVRLQEPEKVVKIFVDAQMNGMVPWYQNVIGPEAQERGQLEAVRPAFATPALRESAERYVEEWPRLMAEEYDAVANYEYYYVRAYSRFFTLPELRELVAFYRTPLGRKVLWHFSDISIHMLQSRIGTAEASERFTDRIMEREIPILREAAKQGGKAN